MEFKKGHHSILRLICISLKAANQSFGSIIASVLLVALFNVLLYGIVFGVSFLSPIIGVILNIPVSILSSFVGLVLPMAMILILACKIEKKGISAYDALTSSIMPSLYYIVSAIILSIPPAILLIAASLSKSITVMLLSYLVILLAYLPFMFLQPALVLRQLGPIEALKYSWEMGTKNYLKLLAILFTVLLTAVIAILAIFCLIKAMNPELILSLTTIPAQFWPFFITSYLNQIALPLLITGIVILVALYAFVFVFMMAFLTALFLDFDAEFSIFGNRDTDSPLLQENLAETPEFSQQNPDHHHVSVQHEAVQTELVDEHTSGHLEQVYNPQEHLDRAVDQEEDRMPTILFDEEMMKQLAENERQMRERKERAQQQDDDTPDSIKMSDKTL